MRARLRALQALVLVAALTGCLGPVRELYPPPPSAPQVVVYVLDHGWHTGIVVPRASVPDDMWPERADFSAFDFVEVGWGDRAYYMAPAGTCGLGCRALCWPTRSVLHVVGVHAPVEQHAPSRVVIAVRLSNKGFRSLCAFVDAAFDRRGRPRAQSLGPGLYGESRFYPARPRYLCHRTCNTWTAQALRAAGCPITPAYALTAANVTRQTRRFGEVLRE